MRSIWNKKLSRRDFLKAATVTGGVGMASYLGLWSQPAYGAVPDLHAQATMKALVDAVVPHTPGLAKTLGPEFVAGGLDASVDEFMVYSFNHYLSLDGETDLPILANVKRSIQAVTQLLSGVSNITGTNGAPLASATAVLLDLYATQLIATGGAQDAPNPLTFPGGGPFASLSRDDRFRALHLMDQADLELPGTPAPYKNNLGLVNFIAGALVEFAAFGFYCEWSGYGTTRALPPEQRVWQNTPLSWEQTGYPGPSDGYADFRGYFVDHFEE